MRFALGAAVPALTLALFVGIMTGQAWATLTVVGVAAAVGVVVALVAGLVHLSGAMGLAGGAARLVTQRNLVVAYVDEGSVKEAAEHEAGHAQAYVANGGQVYRAVVRPDGSGYVSGSLPRTGTKREQLVASIAVTLAGGLREGVDPWTAQQCSGDRKNMNAELRGCRDRAGVIHDATHNARRTMNGSYASRVERALIRRGKF